MKKISRIEKERLEEIQRILSLKENERNLEERLRLAYYKLNVFKKTTYEEFTLMLSTNDELWFYYKNFEFEVVHESPNITTMCVSRLVANEKILERCDDFSSINELLDKFRIEGKTIKEIWDEVIY